MSESAPFFIDVMMVSGTISAVVSYIWLAIVVSSPFSLWLCWKKKNCQAGKEHSTSGDSVRAVARPNMNSKANTSSVTQGSESTKHRMTDVNSMKAAADQQAAKACASEKPTGAEMRNHGEAPQRCLIASHEPSLMATQGSAEQLNVNVKQQSVPIKKDDNNEEQCRSRRRRPCKSKESRKKGMKQNFVKNVLRKAETKRNCKEKNHNSKAITEATQEESLNSAHSPNLKKPRRVKRLSRICPVTNTASKLSRISCVSTQSDMTAGISQVLQQRGMDDKDDEEINNDLDTMAGVRSIEKEETPSPQ